MRPLALRSFISALAGQAVLPLLALAGPACSLFAKSPAVNGPLHERLSKADTSAIEQAANTCYSQAGWKPDDISGYVEGATSVSAKKRNNERVTVYIQAAGANPRVTGGPEYDDPFWKCLSKEMGGGGGPKSTEQASSKDPDQSDKPDKSDDPGK
jgi:hypothetical protein